MPDKRPDFGDGAQSVKLEGKTYYTVPHHEDIGFDAVVVQMIPRWKESELSGDEYRWTHYAKALRKGRVIAAAGGVDLFACVVNLLPQLQTARGWGYLSVDECAQPGCADPPDVLLRLKRQWSKDGTKSSEFDNKVRAFCRQHLRRGDCGMDDNDDNYERVGLRVDGEWVPYPEAPDA